VDDLILMLLDLVFDNVFVVAIVFGIVSFLINKIRGANAPTSGPRRGGMPPFGGEGPPFGGGLSRGEPARPAAPSPLQPGAPRSAGWEPPEPGAQQAPAPEPGAPAHDAQPAPELAAAAARPAPAPRAASAAAPKRRPAGIDPRRAAEGMIWAEVFGPPRAIRPHDSRKR